MKRQVNRGGDVLACFLLLTVTASVRGSSGGGGGFKEQESPEFKFVAKLEEDYIPSWQPVAFSCQFHNKLHEEAVTSSGQINLFTPVITSHNKSFDLAKKVVLDAEGALQLLLVDPTSVHDYQIGQTMQASNANSSQTFGDLHVDRHHPLLSSVAQLKGARSTTDHAGDDQTGFSNFSPINDASNTWLDSFVIDTYHWEASSALRGIASKSNKKRVATWCCERKRYTTTEQKEGAPLVVQQEVLGRSSDAIRTTKLSVNETAMYEINFRNFWSKDTHPYEFPDGATFSEQLIVAHNRDYRLFRPGRKVTEGFELFAEQGNPSLIEEELAHTAMPDSVSSFFLGSGRSLGRIVLDAEHDMVSTATRLSPSPDWFTGLSEVRPIDEGGNWLRGFTVDVYPFDAGTEQGLVYTGVKSGNLDAHDPVTWMTEASISQDYPVFLTTDADGNPKMLPIGQYEFVLTSTTAPTSSSSPAPSSSDDTSKPTNLPTNELQYDHPYLSQMPTMNSVFYEVSFESEWSSDRHPFEYPPDAKFGNHTIVSHNAEYTLWQPKAMASKGIQALAIDGVTLELLEEIEDGGTAVGGFLNHEAGSDSGFVGYLQMDRNHKRISTVCRLDPSPDWFTGITNAKPHAEGYWLREFSTGVVPYDAGIFDGRIYEEIGEGNVPQLPISPMTVDSIDPDSPVFVSENENGQKVILPLGRYLFRLVGTTSPTATPYPAETSVTAVPTATNRPTPVPTTSLTSNPTASEATIAPSTSPTISPTVLPSIMLSTSLEPTQTKAPSLSSHPSGTPSTSPLSSISHMPSMMPSMSYIPLKVPSSSAVPTLSPTNMPSHPPSGAPSQSSTVLPSILEPSASELPSTFTPSSGSTPPSTSSPPSSTTSSSASLEAIPSSSPAILPAATSMHSSLAPLSTPNSTGRPINAPSWAGFDLDGAIISTTDDWFSAYGKSDEEGLAGDAAGTASPVPPTSSPSDTEELLSTPVPTGSPKVTTLPVESVEREDSDGDSSAALMIATSGLLVGFLLFSGSRIFM